VNKENVRINTGGNLMKIRILYMFCFFLYLTFNIYSKWALHNGDSLCVHTSPLCLFAFLIFITDAANFGSRVPLLLTRLVSTPIAVSSEVLSSMTACRLNLSFVND